MRHLCLKSWKALNCRFNISNRYSAIQTSFLFLCLLWLISFSIVLSYLSTCSIILGMKSLVMFFYFLIFIIFLIFRVYSDVSFSMPKLAMTSLLKILLYISKNQLLFLFTQSWVIALVNVLSASCIHLLFLPPLILILLQFPYILEFAFYISDF